VALAEPVPPDSVLADPVLLAEPVMPDPVLAEPVVVDPVLSEPAPAAGGVMSVGLESGPREAGVLDGGDTGVEELPLTGGGTVAVTRGLAVADRRAELDGQDGVLAA
jgi:hypothetical protein